MRLISNEIVFRGHPDKACDQIVGAILDACLKKDTRSRVALDCIIKGRHVYIVGELNTKARIKVKEIARRVLYDIGYTNVRFLVHTRLSKQSSQINKIIKSGTSGDTAVCVGYANSDTSNLLPTAQEILIRLAKEYDKLVHDHPRLYYPDGKAQISGIYDLDNKLITIRTFTVCYHNAERNRPSTDHEISRIVREICGYYQVHVQEVLINPAGSFKVGGFKVDSGMSGRKQNVDAYQLFATVSNGSMNGKDPTKPDVFGSYKARDLAKRILKRNHLEWCEVQLAYAIGKSIPLSIIATSNEGDIELGSEVYKECTPVEVIRLMKLSEPRYEERARFGHFARSPKYYGGQENDSNQENKNND